MNEWGNRHENKWRNQYNRESGVREKQNQGEVPLDSEHRRRFQGGRWKKQKKSGKSDSRAETRIKVGTTKEQSLNEIKQEEAGGGKTRNESIDRGSDSRSWGRSEEWKSTEGETNWGRGGFVRQRGEGCGVAYLLRRCGRERLCTHDWGGQHTFKESRKAELTSAERRKKHTEQQKKTSTEDRGSQEKLRSHKRIANADWDEGRQGRAKAHE